MKLGSLLIPLALLGCRHDLDYCRDNPKCVRTDGAVEASSDASADSAVEDTATGCADAGPLNEGCGKCGTRHRSCNTDGTLSDWSACEGEGVCSASETQAVADPSCTWRESGSHTCSASCTWGAVTCAPTKGWRKIADVPTGFSGRFRHGAVWTGTEMIVFGGIPKSDDPPLGNGARYQLATNTWTPLPVSVNRPSARSSFAMGWTGAKVLIWGGLGASDAVFADGAVYDPATDAFSPMAASPLSARQSPAAIWIPTKKRFFVWGGRSSTADSADGALYDPATNTWTTLPAAPISARSESIIGWNGTNVVVLAGLERKGLDGVGDGALYDPETNTWSALPLPPTARTDRLGPAMATRDDGLFLWGGASAVDFTLLGDGLVLGGTSWTELAMPASSMLDPQRRVGGAAFCSSAKCWIWSGGGVDAGGTMDVRTGGAMVELSSKSWSTLSEAAPIAARMRASSFWTGSSGLVWGGNTLSEDGLADGAIYTP